MPRVCFGCLLGLLLSLTLVRAEQPFRIEQLTTAPGHYFFGYDGHQQTIPWSADGRHILALRTSYQDRMPRDYRDAAEIVLIDATTHAVTPVAACHAWNFQQGTMLFWNPENPNEEFFFNDRGADNRVYTVLFNFKTGKRRDFRFTDVEIANGNVDPAGGRFAAFNYGRIYREVVSYPNAFNATAGAGHPSNDGLFVVDVRTGGRRLLVTYEQLYAALKDRFPELSKPATGIFNQLFINHTYWNRDGDRLWFVARWFREDSRTTYYSEGFTVDVKSGVLRHSPVVLSHPDWERGHRIVSGGLAVPSGKLDAAGKPRREHVIYDTDAQKVIDLIDGEFFTESGEPALSPSMRWIASTENGRDERGPGRRIIVYDRVTRSGFKLPLFPNEAPRSAEIDSPFRIDMPPRWNRDGTKILFETLANDGTRQLYIAHLTIPSGQR